MSDLHAGNRREDKRFITGRGRYTSDWNLPRQAHAAFLRADHAHAEIISIDVAAALKRPGVIAVFTGADAVAAGYTEFPLMANFTNKQGASLIKPDRPVLAHGKVRYVGETVALVVAESALQAHDALEAIAIEYRDLPAAVTVDDALAPDAGQLHASAPGNLSLEWDAGDAAAVDAAFSKAAHITRLAASTTRVTASPMELRGYLISYDAAADSYDIYTAAQGLNVLNDQIAKLTKLPHEKVRLQLHDVGGSFGQRSGVYPEHAAMMMASKKLGRPIKWVSSRSEGFMSDAHGRAIRLSGELALDRDGKFLGARYQIACDMGAYLTPGGPAGHVRNVARCMTGVYNTPALYGAWKVVFTNAAPVAAYRGAGRPDIAYIIERLVDKAAVELKIDRAEIRRRNFIPLDAFPYKSMTGGVYEKSDFAGCLEQALRDADWAGFEKRRAAARAAGKLRGIGLAVVIEGTGGGQYPKDQAAIEFDAQGNLSLFVGSLSGGQSHETTFTAVAAQVLGVDPETITLRQSVLGKNIIGNNTGGSRAMICTGSVCMVAAQKLIEQARPLAAETLELEPSQIEYANGVFSTRDSEKSIGLFDLARRLAGKNPHPLNLVAEGAFGITFPNGCHIAEVEIDPETGVTSIVSYVAVDDCGKAINHQIVEGQVHGGVTQGAGQIFGEHMVYDRDSGQLLAGSFSDYCMPHAGLIRDIRLGEHLVPSKENPLGAKGVGESGCTASLPTLANATMDALRPLGIQDLEMPFTPSKIWHAIQAVKGR
jgi:aerobic carbon-monoxide dehydrogenase large subunit